MDEIFKLIEQEKELQARTLRLIPSENYTSRGVREAVGSVLMHKYSEGYPGKRYYPGNQVMDQIERLCQERALKAFGLDEAEWGVNVQALSGSPANLAVYTALLEPGDKILAMYLPDGGHLSHGWQYGGRKVTLVSKVWNIGYYHVDSKTEKLNYNEIAKIAEDFQPKLIISGGTAYPREIDYKRMGEIAREVGAYYLADVAHEAGLIAAGVCQSPFAYADVVTMTTHKTLRGPRGALIFSRKKSKQITDDRLQMTDLSTMIDRAVFPGLQGGPHDEVIAGIAVALQETQSESFRAYATQVVKNAQILAELLVKAGYQVVSGGTDKYLVLLDLRNKHLSGWVVDKALEQAGIIANRNTVPNETASPFYPSGLRLGTPFVTSRGMKEAETEMIAGWIDEIIRLCGQWRLPEERESRRSFVKKFKAELVDQPELKRIRGEVEQLCVRFPLPR